MSVGELDVVPDLQRHGGGVGVDEAVDESRRCGLGRRRTAAGGDQLVRRRHDRAAEYSQHGYFKTPTESKRKNKIK